MGKKSILGRFVINVILATIILAIPFGQMQPTVSAQDPMLLSMVVNWQGEIDDLTIDLFETGFQQAADAGVTIYYVYYEWGELEPGNGEFKWDDLDFNLLTAHEHGMRVALAIKVIDNNHAASLPNDMTFSTFDDPILIARFNTFALALLDHTQGKIGYVWIGNEIDNYLAAHRAEIPAYQSFYAQVYAAIKAHHQDVQIGTISTYHEALTEDALDIIETVGAEGDLIGFSLYPEMIPGATPADTMAYFDHMAAIAGRLDQKFAITETSWSTAGPDGSTDLQCAFVDALFDAYETHAQSVDYVGWFILFDFSPSITEIILAVYGIDAAQSAEFADFVRTTGLLHNDGTPKEAWAVFLARAARRH